MFLELAKHLEHNDIQMTIKKKGDKLSVALFIKPITADKDKTDYSGIKPLLICETPEWFEKNFVPTIAEPLEFSSTTLHNIEVFKKSLSSTEKSATTVKEVAGKKDEKKKDTKQTNIADAPKEKAKELSPGKQAEKQVNEEIEKAKLAMAEKDYTLALTTLEDATILANSKQKEQIKPMIMQIKIKLKAQEEGIEEPKEKKDLQEFLDKTPEGGLEQIFPAEPEEEQEEKEVETDNEALPFND